jgi:hypothetical protein|tara:strand:+ start:132 stop:596 length:465 start_codon:yes stop_codon:yes gene_type:complete
MDWDYIPGHTEVIMIDYKPRIVGRNKIVANKHVNVKQLMLTPLTVREVERNLLLWRAGRAALMNHRQTTLPMRLLTRLVNTGHEVIASHVLTILGGPMERMADWGDKRRRPCIVPIKVQTMISGPGVFFSRDSMALGSVENYRCPVPYRIPGEN